MKSVIVVLILAMAAIASAEIYTWKDKRGTEFFTNSIDEIPARYRSKAKVLDVATGKRIPLSAAPAATQTGGAPGGPQPAQPAPSTAPTPAPQPSPAPASTSVPPPAPPVPAIPETRAPQVPDRQPQAIGPLRRAERRLRAPRNAEE